MKLAEGELLLRGGLGDLGGASGTVGGNCWTALSALELGLDAAAVGCGPDLWEDRTDGVDEAGLHRWVGVVESSLDDVVGKGVAQEALEIGGRGEHLLNQHVLAWLLGAAQALLNDVAAELLARQLANTAGEHGNERLGEDWLVEIEDVLHDVVAEGVLNESERVVGDLADQPGLLLATGVVNAALQHAATVAVGTDVDTVASNCIEDELRIERGQLVQALLDDMVAVEILDQLDDLVAQSLDNGLDLASS